MRGAEAEAAGQLVAHAVGHQVPRALSHTARGEPGMACHQTGAPQTSPAGFYDYGPPGCAMKQNVTQTWRNHFVLEENMLEVGGWGRGGGGGSAVGSSSMGAQLCCLSMPWCLELRPVKLWCCSTP